MAPDKALAKFPGSLNVFTVKKAIGVIAGSAVLVCSLWVGLNGAKLAKTADSKSSQVKTHPTESLDEIESPLRTKAAEREALGPQATHAPEQLKDFILPEVVIEGLTLDESLRKLMEVYNAVCKESGETPLRLMFDVPPGAIKKLNLRLRGKNFNSSVQLLASIAGMNVKRRRLAYQFELLIDERMPVSRGIRVSPAFTSTLSELAGQIAEAEFAEQTSVNELVRKLMVDLDPSTRFSLSADGLLNLETTSTADARAVSALIEGINSQQPMQHKLSSMVATLPPGVEWAPPDESRMTDAQRQIYLRGFAQTPGVEMMSLPSLTSRSGERNNVEILSEWVYPEADSREKFASRDVGWILELQSSPLGFGHQLTFNCTQTTAKADPSTGMPTFDQRIDVTESGFASDAGTRFAVQPHPDGSKSVVLVTARLIDATGQPVHEPE